MRSERKLRVDTSTSVAKPATNPRAPGLENSKGSSTTGAGPTTATPRGFGRNLFPAKALASAAKPERAGGRSGRRARVGGGLVLGLRKWQEE